VQDRNYSPLDIKMLRETVQRESARLNLRAYSSEGESSFTLALALSAAMKKIFFEKSKQTFSSEPLLEKKVVTQFVHRMRVDAMEKFNSTTVFSVVQFAADLGALEQLQYMVTLVVYVEQQFLPDFLRLLQYPYIDADEDSECKDGCGAIANLLGGQYKRELAVLGYKDLEMSPFNSFINTAPDGVGVPKEVREKFEISFSIEGAKRLVVEMVTLDMLPKWQTREKMVSKKILVIEDERAFIKTYESFLHTQGFEVIVANDVAEGIKKLDISPHLIIFDTLMPGMNADEFFLAKKKTEGAQQIPVVVLIAREDQAEMFKKEGVKEYLVKPFQPAALLKCIQRCI